ncbi:MAG: glycosyltransferase family 2 protein [Candidatus Magasanikbacteria bacterium CG_4_9_14_0_2_um_filter_42_11]|uniref:Glycosyltransferase family 2 protein n=1 Tax=Candidatus Magasanikbacteria bacterium CG_4_9_14_0_2_um_filter_42_11 TaxID=1974643 RepID=A0A2M8F8H4_9BACT|nr:MAG: glycosyltransferase family 2 protein [Candidatus Magasanikbacteria bacterium CG10_big_fil_rev_8_21_14_0_10_43_9]PIY92197.1 MAG: glycosyltransferase family 2 protein [Candidatus Magasanikbacteria bacterium CG_4_10_14_0_8_um_filter_42_12]PJC51998.1 MAG: glycosyltransferase family 2 protein [Candidatus Magasanikbacteria bacterium CG_4_9_14_0_2_um_filter_42_11]
MFLAIVPAYNESERVGSVVRSLLAHVDAVVVVDDGSMDDTAEVAREAGAVVIRHRLNRGQGAALETGHTYARNIGATYVLHFDADGQFSVDDIEPALSVMKKEHVDIIFGTRYIDTRSNVPWTKKYILRPVGKLVDRLFGGVHLSDAHNGFRIFNKKALEHMHLSHSGMAHASEIPALVKKHNLSYIEVPVSVTYHEYGQGIGGGVRVVRDLVLGKFSK